MKGTAHRLHCGIQLLLFSSFFGIAVSAVAQYRVHTIPSPKDQGQDYYVSNPSGILTMHTVDSLNRLARLVDDLSRNLARKSGFFYRNRALLLSLALAIAVYHLLWKTAVRTESRIPTRRGRKRKRRSANIYLLFSGAALFVGMFVLIFPVAFLGLPPSWLYRWSLLPVYVALFYSLAITFVYAESLTLIRETFEDAANRLKQTVALHRRMALPLLASPTARPTTGSGLEARGPR